MPLSRTVYLKPPPEAKTSDLWKLLQAVYGLSDASRHWYDRIKVVLIEHGVTVSKLDPAVFFYFVDSVLHGILVAHVDDFFVAGSKLFHSYVVDAIRKTFIVGLEEIQCLKYLGLNVNQNDRGFITVSLHDYIHSISDVNLDSVCKLEKAEAS